MPRSILIEAAGGTATGLRRHINQDLFTLRPDLGLYFILDGMGGHAAGEHAAAIASVAIQSFYDDPGRPERGDSQGLRNAPRAFLAAAVKHANLCIREQAAREPEKRGMGAAVVALHATTTGFCVAHVGHARCYRLRDGRLEQLTEDHTRLNEYLWRGTPLDTAERMPDKSTLSRALGSRDSVEVTAGMDDTRPGDVVLLSSNGLHDALAGEELARVLAGQSDVAATAAALIGLAGARRAPDDSSCVVLRWCEAARSPTAA